MQNFNEDWQVEVQGQIYIANLKEIKQWIAEGAVLPSDKVKRGNLRWLTAEKAPEICGFFNSDNLDTEFPYAVTEKSSESEYANFQTQFAFKVLAEENASEWKIEKVCYLHSVLEVVFVCDICQKSFCKTCPKSYGGTVKICPLCDSLCRSVDEPVKILKSVGGINKPYSRIDEKTGKLGKQNQSKLQKADFAKAFAYSFKYLTSIIWVVKVSIFSQLNKLRRQ